MVNKFNNTNIYGLNKFEIVVILLTHPLYLLYVIICYIAYYFKNLAEDFSQLFIEKLYGKKVWRIICNILNPILWIYLMIFGTITRIFEGVTGERNPKWLYYLCPLVMICLVISAIPRFWVLFTSLYFAGKQTFDRFTTLKI